MSQELVDRAMDAYRLAHMLMEGKVGSAVAEAIPHLRIAADCYGQALRSQQRAHVLVELGKLHQRCNDNAGAVPEFEEALKIYRDLGERHAAAAAGVLAGLALKAQGKFDLAHAYLERALAVHRDGGELVDVAQTLSTVASVYLDERKPAEALTRYREALAIYIRFTKRAEIAHVHEMMGVAQQLAGDFEAAAKDFEISIATKQNNLGDMKGAARTLGRFADMERHRGAYDSSSRLYQRCLDIHRMRNDQALIAQTLGNIGTVHALRGDHRLALEQYARCFEISASVGERPATAQALYNIGCMHLQLAEDPQALDAFTRSMAICDELGSRSLAERILAALTEIYQRAGDRVQAEASARRRADLLDALGRNDDLLHVLDDLLTAAVAREDWEAASDYERRAIACGRDLLAAPELAARRFHLGALAVRQGDHQAACEHFMQAMNLYGGLGRSDDLARTLRNLGAAELQLGASADALGHYQRALELCETSGDKKAMASALVGIGNARIQLGATAEAKQAFDRAATLSDQIGDVKGTSIIRKATNAL